MSISSRMVVGVVATALSLGGVSSFAGEDRYDGRHGQRYDQRYDPRYDDRYDPRYDPRTHPRYEESRYADGRYEDGEGLYDYARVVDVQPLMTRVRVSTPQRECWDEVRYDDRGPGYGSRSSAGGALVGAVIGGVLGSQIGSGRGRDAATAAGAVIGAGIGHRQAERRNAANLPPPREYTVQRCETRYQSEYEERVDGYRVTYVYNGRRQVTELPYKPGERIRVRVDVSPAE
jgi:uncharacterized protein YcfJ